MKNKIKFNNKTELFINNSKTFSSRTSWIILYLIIEKVTTEKQNKATVEIEELLENFKFKNFNLKNFKTQIKKDLNNFKENNIIKSFEINKYNFMVELDSDVYNNDNKNKYFYLSKEEIKLLINKDLNPNDLKLLMFFKTNSFKCKISFVKVNVEYLYKILGINKSYSTSDVEKRFLIPFVKNILNNTNYIISFEKYYSRLNKKFLQKIIFKVDNQKELINKFWRRVDNFGGDDEKANEIIDKFKKEEIHIKISDHEKKVCVNHLAMIK